MIEKRTPQSRKDKTKKKEKFDKKNAAIFCAMQRFHSQLIGICGNELQNDCGE